MNFKSDTERQACREKIKWGAVIVAIVLLAVAVAAACTQGFTNANPWGWFGKEKEEQTVEKLAVLPADEAGELVAQEVQSNERLSLQKNTIPRVKYAASGISPMALDAVTVSVKSPVSGLTYKWALSMANGTPSTYITLSADNGTSVDLTCKAAFSSVITLTCSETFEDQVLSTASCTLNYFKRVTGVTLNGTALSTNGSFDLSKLAPSATSLKDALKTATLSFSETLGTGTTGSAGDYYGRYVFNYTVNSQSKAITTAIAKNGNGTFSVSLADLYVNMFWTATSGAGGQITGALTKDALLEKVKAGTATDQFYTALLTFVKQFNVKFGLMVGKGAAGSGVVGSSMGTDNVYTLTGVSLSVPSTWKATSASVALDKGNIEF